MATSAEERIEVGVPLSSAHSQWTQFEELPRLVLQLDFDPERLVGSAGDDLAAVERRAKDDSERLREFIEWHGTETRTRRGDVPRHRRT